MAGGAWPLLSMHARVCAWLPAACLAGQYLAPLLHLSLATPPRAKQVTPQGEVQQLELAKLRVTHTLGVQLRDLR